MGLKIISCGIGKAEKIFKNADFEKILETSDEWIKTRTGIEQRMFISENQSGESLATTAAAEALQKSGVDKSDIKILIVATFTPDSSMPSAACKVGKNLGLSEDVICFDLNSACTGYVTALNVAHSLLGDIKNGYALVVGCDVLSRILDMTDRTTAILFGDGAGAAVVKRDDSVEYGYIPGFVHDNDNVLHIDSESGHVVMDGKPIFRFAVDKMSYAINKILEQNGLCIDDIDLIIPHQANKRIIYSVQKRLSIPAEKMVVSLQNYGNTSAASIPMALYEAGDVKNKRILCIGFGAGLTYGAVLING